MPNFDNWLDSGYEFAGVIPAPSRAARAWARINRRPTWVSLIRDGAALAGQLMRVEVGNGGNYQATPNGLVTVQSVVVFGVKDHPTVTDTNMQRGDRFVFEDQMYEISAVVRPPGEVQGFGEVRSNAV